MAASEPENHLRRCAEQLGAVYGGASQAGMGSAVFVVPSSPEHDLVESARERVHHFCRGKAASTAVWEVLVDSPGPVEGGLMAHLSAAKAQSDTITVDLSVDQLL
eukprot:RCo005476